MRKRKERRRPRGGPWQPWGPSSVGMTTSAQASTPPSASTPCRTSPSCSVRCGSDKKSRAPSSALAPMPAKGAHLPLPSLSPTSPPGYLSSTPHPLPTPKPPRPVKAGALQLRRWRTLTRAHSPSTSPLGTESEPSSLLRRAAVAEVALPVVEVAVVVVTKEMDSHQKAESPKLWRSPPHPCCSQGATSAPSPSTVQRCHLAPSLLPSSLHR